MSRGKHTDRLRSSLFLLAAIVEQGPDVVAAVVGRGEAADTATVLGAFKTFGRKLKAAVNLAVARDRKLHDLRSEEAALRRDRDKTKRRLGRLIVGLRRMVRGAYVAPDLVVPPRGAQAGGPRAAQDPGSARKGPAPHRRHVREEPSTGAGSLSRRVLISAYPAVMAESAELRA